MSQSIIEIGSIGEDVKYLQQSLTKLGYNPGPIDGIFGSKTETAVRSFQTAKGLVVDGIVGKTTWAAINQIMNVISVSYQGHVQNIGWQNWVNDGQEAGTDGKALRLEALKIKLVNAPTKTSIKYQAHVQNVGWQNWVSNGQEAGTDGKSLRMEAIRITLENMPGYSVQYQAHVQNVGWQNWVSDGQEAGTDGKSLRMEAIRIRIVSVNNIDTLGIGNKVVSYAEKFIGVPYVYGGTTPSGFDCSGFIQYVYAHNGSYQIQLPRTTYDQINVGTPISKSNLQSGDLVFFGSESSPHHVGMYIGSNQFIEAPHTGDNVRISTLDTRTDFCAVRRVIK